MRADAITLISRQRLRGSVDGSSAYLLSLCAAMRDAGFRLHLVSPTPAAFGRWPAIWLGGEMAMFDTIAMRGAWRLGRLVVARDPRVLLGATYAVVGSVLRRAGLRGWRSTPAAYAIGLPVSDADRRFVARHAPAGAAAVIADYAFLTELIAYAPARRSLVVMHDLFSSRPAQFARVGCADSTRCVTEEEELRMLARAGCVVAIQPEEAALVARRLPGTLVIDVPMAVRPVAAPQPGVGGVLLVGSGAAPNVDAVAWLLSAIWPRVREALPDALLTIAGAAGLSVGKAPEGVRIIGRVGDLAPLYRDMAVVVAPLRAGSGLKVKLIEALGHGKAVVATEVTMQGVSEAARNAVIIADDPAVFAQAIVALLRDPAARRRLATAALAVARTHHAPEACSRALIETLRTS